MDNNLYYEKTNITATAEVKETFEHAVKNNYKYYRAVTEKGAIFGWLGNKPIKAIEGKEWFVNENYIEHKEKSFDLSADIEENIENNDLTSQDEQITATEEVQENTIDYKQLYEETLAILEATKKEAENNLMAYTQVKQELDSVRNAFTLIANELKLAIEKE